jgi:CBS domain-containing protein
MVNRTVQNAERPAIREAAMHVAQILKAKGDRVETVGETVSIAKVSQMLREKRIGAVVVTGGDGAVSGILSEKEIVHGLAAYGTALLGMTAAQIMNREVVTCTPESRVEELMREMTTRRARHLPVIHQGALAGIVSIGDVVKWRLDELQSEAQSLRDYVTGSR